MHTPSWGRGTVCASARSSGRLRRAVGAGIVSGPSETKVAARPVYFAGLRWTSGFGGGVSGGLWGFLFLEPQGT